MNTFDRLKTIVKQSVADEGGCSWLKTKSFQEIVNYTLEEVYELIEAIEHEDDNAIRDELADFCYHVLIYAEIGAKTQKFDLDDIAQAAIDKQEQRKRLQTLSTHSAEESHDYWLSKKREARKDKSTSLLSDISAAMPAILHAHKIQDRVAEVGFDWQQPNLVLDKLKEEISELEAEMQTEDKQGMLSELGDILFTVVNLARKLDCNPEKALRHTNRKFSNRFHHMEQQAKLNQQSLEELSTQELEQLWQNAKVQF